MSCERLAMAVACLALLAGVTGADVVTHTESWDLGPADGDAGRNGWRTTSALDWHSTGGLNDSGFIEAYAATTASPAAVRGRDIVPVPSGGVFHNNVDDRYTGGVPDGHIHISFYVKNNSPSPNDSRNVIVEIFDNTNEFAATSTWWRTSLPFLITSTGWTEVTTTINTNWTDADAMAAGWARVGGQGTASWVSVWQNVDAIRFGPSASLTNDSVNGRSRLGFDELTFTNTVPEPASVGLLGLGGLALLRRHRSR